MRLRFIAEKLLYKRLRQGRRGSRILYGFASYPYCLISTRIPYMGTRIAEIPWVLKELRSLTHGGERILQVGDVILKNALNKYEVELIDLSAEEEPAPGLKVHKADIRGVSLPVNYFDIAISISTLEHIGIMEPNFPDGDRLAISIIYQALKPRGLFLFTVPFGEPAVLKTMRRYNKNRLDFILDSLFTIEEEIFLVWNKLKAKWEEKASKEAEQFGSLKEGTNMSWSIALVKARRLG